MSDLPVVVVVATHGEDRLHLLTERALPSIANQTSKADLVVVVSDNDPLSEFLEEEDITRCFDVGYRHKVRLVPNARTRGNSGTGAWNTGILEAASFERDCWVAILDDDDQWEEGHIEACLKAATSTCQWVVSGLIRCSKSGRKKEQLPTSKPNAEDFFSTNPGIQGSNLFVHVQALLGAGLFDERMPSTTDRDLCIRLCDLLSGRAEGWFSSTSKYSVIHYADPDRSRVSSRGSPAKIQGLKKFYQKYAPRMSDFQRREFKERAAHLFDCNEEEFRAEKHSKQPLTLEAWSGDKLPLNIGSYERLPKFSAATPCTEKRDVIFGVITSDIRRVIPLLDDLSAALGSQHCGFNPFIVVFANSCNAKLSMEVKCEAKKRSLRSHVLPRASPVVGSIVYRCKDASLSIAEERLPIAIARTVLQVFIYNMPILGDAEAVVIIDDDKRLPKGWSPFASSIGEEDGADIMIGRDLRTPPNPSIFSLRTNLVDLMYNLDLAHAEGAGTEDVTSYCLAQSHQESDKFDWYYDLSSSRLDHLEMPVYREKLDINNDGFAQGLLRQFLTGTPLCRDVIPPFESGPTLQRGGLMCIINKKNDSFNPLAVQQHAPLIEFIDGTTSFTRRSDSFWCKQMKDRGLDVAVNNKLFVYHDNSFDNIASPPSIRRNVVQEVIGGILCREVRWRKKYKDGRLLEMRGWLARVRGILTSLRNRHHCTVELVDKFIEPLESVLSPEKWDEEVFAVIEKTFDTSLQHYEPDPVDFARLHDFIELDVDEMNMLKEKWNKGRIENAHNILEKATGEEASYVGIGSEGVSFCVNDVLYKVFDAASSNLPSPKTIKFLDSTYLTVNSLPPILKRPYSQGIPYRGGHGLSMVRMLRKWKSMRLIHTNLTPDNLVFNKDDQTLTVIDIGRDVHHEESEYFYHERFRDMCKRAYLSFRFGSHASNPYALKELKQRMRDDNSSLYLTGFENFIRSVYDGEIDHRELLSRKLDEMNAVCGYILSSENSDDVDVVACMNEAISQKAASGCFRVGIIIQDPFRQQLDGHASKRHPLWFFRRHIYRMQNILEFSMEEDSVISIDSATFQDYVKFHIFVLDFEVTTSEKNGTSARNGGVTFIKSHLMIKSCPMEHKTILADVRRTVHSLESSAIFKSIVLVADIRETRGFLRQCITVDMDEYANQLKSIEDERLVDHIVMFDGKDLSQVSKLSKRWLGRYCRATAQPASCVINVEDGQHFSSTFFGFNFIKDLKSYCVNDLVLQMDSDIILHCENGGGVVELTSHFDDPKLVSIAFPILSSHTIGSHIRHLNHDGKPFRFESHCSLVHPHRIFSMLPFEIPDHQASADNSSLKRGWWRSFDSNIENRGLKSARACVGDGKRLFFIHPPNEFKEGDVMNKLGIVADIISSKHISAADLEKKLPWDQQLDQVDLQSVGKGWLQDRHESVVVAIDISCASYGSALHSFETLKHTSARKMFKGCGIILLDNGSANKEDIVSTLFERAIDVFGNTRLTTISLRKQLGPQELQLVVKSMCINKHVLVFTSNGNNFDLHSAKCLLPHHSLKICPECGGYYNQACLCYDGSSCEFDGIPCTSLPVCFPPMPKQDENQLSNTSFFASDNILEGKLNIEIGALVNGFDVIAQAENVFVRIHSECLTGDNFYSMKCDCGLQKLQFMHLMAQEERSSRPSVLVIIKGHEGRGAGLYNKIKAYRYLDQHPDKTHVDSLHAIGCESDTRKYDAAVKFIKYKLKVRSIKLFTNNPQKIKAVREHFGSNFSVQAMPAALSPHNEKYLKEKVGIFGHKGLF